MEDNYSDLAMSAEKYMINNFNDRGAKIHIFDGCVFFEYYDERFEKNTHRFFSGDVSYGMSIDIESESESESISHIVASSDQYSMLEIYRSYHRMSIWEMRQWRYFNGIDAILFGYLLNTWHIFDAHISKMKALRKAWEDMWQEIKKDKSKHSDYFSRNKYNEEQISNSELQKKFQYFGLHGTISKHNAHNKMNEICRILRKMTQFNLEMRKIVAIFAVN